MNYIDDYFSIPWRYVSMEKNQENDIQLKYSNKISHIDVNVIDHFFLPYGWLSLSNRRDGASNVYILEIDFHV